jgi:hypothetical protein
VTPTALRAIEIVIGIAVGIGTLELLAVRRAMADDGIWRWETLAAELGGLRTVLAYGPFQVVLGARLVAAALLVGGVRGPVAPVLWFTTLLVNVRFRGTFNGGSDLMTMVVLTALVVAHLGAGSAVAVNLAIIYVAVQGVLSYFVAGIVKAVNPDWWRGDALAAFVARPDLGTPAVVRRALGGPLGRPVSWLVIGFELAFPLAFTGVPAAVVLVAGALVFHLGTVVVFGLNRFLLTWAATWPAVVYVAYGL